MLEKEKSIDAVNIATPDHLHAYIASTAIKMGKHVYVQKPLTHSVYEARLLAKLAKDYGVATQMGNQGSAENGLRRGVEVIQSGIIGNITEVYVWSNRPIWPQGDARPEGADPFRMGWIGINGLVRRRCVLTRGRSTWRGSRRRRHPAGSCELLSHVQLAGLDGFRDWGIG